MKNFIICLFTIVLLISCGFGNNRGAGNYQQNLPQEAGNNYGSENYQQSANSRETVPQESQSDYNPTVKVIAADITYDENFIPHAKFAVNNPTNKTVTNFIVVTKFAQEGSDRNDIFAQENVENKVDTIIKPHQTVIANVDIFLQHTNYKYSGIMFIENARFSDGSIQTIQ